jgi:phosphatidate cytidylyltransferase
MTLSAPSGPDLAKTGRSELSRRILSGAIMAAGALGLTVAGGWWFASLVGIASVLMCWEWGRLTRTLDTRVETPGVLGIDPSLLLHAAVTVAAVVLVAIGKAGWAAALLAAGAAGLFVLSPGQLLPAFGAVYVGLPAFVLVWLRQDAEYGLAAVLYLYLAVWVTDIAAYAAGRTMGGPKLAPSISPGKTWSGLIGGVACAGLAGAAFSTFIAGGSALRLGVLAVALAIAAQLGDLYESSLKRRSGLKDASNLIPGHGGILDRVDGLVAAIALALLVILLSHANSPARGLVGGL